jgi:hypothetical protein
MQAKVTTTDIRYGIIAMTVTATQRGMGTGMSIRPCTGMTIMIAMVDIGIIRTTVGTVACIIGRITATGGIGIAGTRTAATTIRTAHGTSSSVIPSMIDRNRAASAQDAPRRIWPPQPRQNALDSRAVLPCSFR